MSKHKTLIWAMLAAAGVLAATAASAAPRESASDDLTMGRDLISVSAANRHAQFPSASCIVWADAEGLGVGPSQLNGYQGLSMTINTHPLPSESVTTFAAGIAELKARSPKAPAWLIRTIEKSQSAIEAECLQEHLTPYKIRAITKRDRDG